MSKSMCRLKRIVQPNISMISKEVTKASAAD